MQCRRKCPIVREVSSSVEKMEKKKIIKEKEREKKKKKKRDEYTSKLNNAILSVSDKGIAMHFVGFTFVSGTRNARTPLA